MALNSFKYNHLMPVYTSKGKL